MLRNFFVNYSFRKSLRNRYITQYSISENIETLMLKARRILFFYIMENKNIIFVNKSLRLLIKP